MSSLVIEPESPDLVCQLDKVQGIVDALTSVRWKRHQDAVVELSEHGIVLIVEETACLQAKVYLQRELFVRYECSAEGRPRFGVSLGLFVDCLNTFSVPGHSSIIEICYPGPDMQLLLKSVDSSGACTYAEIRTRIPDTISWDYNFEPAGSTPLSFTVKILDTLNVKDKIPDHYILKRWTKDVTNLVAMEIKVFTEGSDPKVEVSTRYRHLCQTIVQIASEASESREGYELVAQYSNEIIAKLKEVKIKNESHESPPVLSKVLHDETIFVDSANVTNVTGLKKKQPTRRSNTRPKSFVEKTRKKKNKIQSPVSPPLQTVQHVSYLAGLQAPCPPLSNATTNTGLREENSYPWYSSESSQLTSHGSLSQLLRDISFHNLNKYSQG